MNKIKINYTETQRKILLGITTAQMGFSYHDGKAINSILNDMSSKFHPYPHRKEYSRSLKYYQANALVVVAKILREEFKDDPLILSTCTSVIQQVEPKL